MLVGVPGRTAYCPKPGIYEALRGCGQEPSEDHGSWRVGDSPGIGNGKTAFEQCERVLFFGCFVVSCALVLLG